MLWEDAGSCTKGAEGLELRARLPMDGRLATSDCADRQRKSAR